MSKAKHTPGPLTVRPTVKNIETINSAGDVIFSRTWPAFSSADRTVADVLECANFTGKHLSSKREECSRANKLALSDEILRAAAPELLEALEFLLGTSAALHRETDEVGWGSVLQARAAIDKAKGE